MYYAVAQHMLGHGIGRYTHWDCGLCACYISLLCLRQSNGIVWRILFTMGLLCL